MRRSLIVTVAAAVSMVLLAMLVPMAILLRDYALEDRLASAALEVQATESVVSGAGTEADRGSLVTPWCATAAGVGAGNRLELPRRSRLLQSLTCISLIFRTRTPALKRAIRLWWIPRLTWIRLFTAEPCSRE